LFYVVLEIIESHLFNVLNICIFDKTTKEKYKQIQTVGAVILQSPENAGLWFCVSSVLCALSGLEDFGSTGPSLACAYGRVCVYFLLYNLVISA